MGRVVKNAPASAETYIVVPPVSVGGNGKAAEDATFHDVIEAAPEPAQILPPPVEEQPIDWPALHREAASLIDAASADAEAIIAHAHDQVRTIVESAHQGALGVTQAARSEGHKQGRAEGIAAAENEMQEMLATMRALIDMARIERHKIVEGAEGEIVKLAMGIAERILHKAVELDREVVVAMTKAAITQLVDRESITVRVNPIDLERMKEHRDHVLALGETKHMRVIEDQRVDPGGVVVETEGGTLDAKVSTQIEEARRVLHVDDGEALIEAAPQSPLPRSNGPTSAATPQTN